MSANDNIRAVGGHRYDQAVLLMADAMEDRWERERISNNSDPTYDAEAALDALLARHHLLVRLAIEAGALRFYSLCSAHGGRTVSGCKACHTGSYGITAHEGRWIELPDAAEDDQ